MLKASLLRLAFTGCFNVPSVLTEEDVRSSKTLKYFYPMKLPAIIEMF